MRVVFSPEARLELDEACAWYESELPGLGQRLRREVRAALPRIRSWPQGWPVLRGEVRKYVLTRFPYKLLYSVETDHLFIIALAHNHRHPDYWTDRAKG